MMKMDDDVVVMTMPDLDSYHLKRSYIRKDVTYVFIPHGIDSINLTQRYKSINAYDIFFACGKYQRLEAEATYKKFGLENKVFNWGYSLLDDMIADYKKDKNTKKANKNKTILIAPSWQKDNICDLCLEELIDNLKTNKTYKIIGCSNYEFKTKYDNYQHLYNAVLIHISNEINQELLSNICLEQNPQKIPSGCKD